MHPRTILTSPATASVIVHRDLLSMTSELGEIWIAIKYAAGALGDAAEDGSRYAMRRAVAELKEAQRALAVLVAEVEEEMAE
jgi:hypothetical protein